MRAKPDTGESVLELRDVTVAQGGGLAVAIQNVSFRLDAGEIGLVCLEEGREHTVLADVAEGLVVPDAGEVAFLGETWESMSVHRQSAMRGRIRRVFHQDGWISNLDVLENICLAECHHTHRPEAEIIAEAVALARRFGVEEIPESRSSRVAPALLRKLEWVRALLGQPALVILERPLQGALRADAQRLIDAVIEEAGQGAAILWLTDEPRVCECREFARLKRFKMDGERLCPLAGEGA